jgi:hypothetical protein
MNMPHMLEKKSIEVQLYRCYCMLGYKTNKNKKYLFLVNITIWYPKVSAHLDMGGIATVIDT